MKKALLLLAAMMVIVSSQSRADILNVNEEIKKLPEFETGVAYSLIDNKLNAMATIRAVEYKALSLNVGYIGDADSTNHKAALALSLKLLNLGDIVKFPILDKMVIEPALYVGFGNINFKEMGESEFDYGVGATILKLKF